MKTDIIAVVDITTAAHQKAEVLPIFEPFLFLPFHSQQALMSCSGNGGLLVKAGLS
jgi:hypothetical protein